eukprot:gene7791-10585_t
MSFIALLIFFIFSCSDAYVNNFNLLSKATRLYAVGTDALVRPEDENSPEYKEYLRMLLAMTANRAKVGFAAASSGSSDAYFAKLNRLKLEKIARKKAGLPDLPIDGSYSPADFQNAAFEGQEPVISSSSLGDFSAGGKGGKIRPISEQEKLAARLADEKVRLELARAQGIDVEQAPAYTLETVRTDSGILLNRQLVDPSNVNFVLPDLKKLNSEEAKTIDAILNKMNPNEIAPVATTQSTRPSTQNIRDIKPIVTGDKKNYYKQPVESNEDLPNNKLPQETSIDSPPPKKNPYVSPSEPTTQQVYATSPTEVTRVTSAKSQPQAQAQPAETITSTKAKPPTQPTEVLKRKLDSDEIEIVGKALQLAVRHRGGGPFGSGRLEGGEVEDLEQSLRSAYDLLKKDSSESTVVKVTTSSKPITEEKTKLPPIKSVEVDVTPPPLQKQPVSTPAKPIRIDTVLLTDEVKPTPSKPTISDKPTPIPVTVDTKNEVAAPKVPLAVGLDKFLASPSSTDLSELRALQSALIRCLSFIQDQIDDKESSSSGQLSSQPTTSSVPDPSLSRVINRVSETNSNPSGEIDAMKEYKLTLGLLLKHRGGPGFGHGRLQGKELAILDAKLKSAGALLLAESI